MYLLSASADDLDQGRRLLAHLSSRLSRSERRDRAELRTVDDETKAHTQGRKQSRQAWGRADGFAVCAGDQYKIIKIKFVASMIAVTPATASSKASLASC